MQNRVPDQYGTGQGNNFTLRVVIIFMRRAVRIVLKAGIIYVAMSLLVGIFMAELTLHPGRTHPNQPRIAEMYAQYGAELQPISIRAADGADLRAWYSIPKH